MATIRVAPRGEPNAPNEEGHISTLLTEWVLRHIKRRNALTPGVALTPETLIEKTHNRQLAGRERELERHIPFSWFRYVVGVASLLLVSSDVLRSGIGVSDMRKHYPSLQPDEALAFGTSWNYTVYEAAKDDSIPDAHVWGYKFDSTSIVWRAFAAYLNVSEFPECLFYHMPCSEENLDGEIAFNMLDALMEAAAALELNMANDGPSVLTLRTESEYIDRFHQFLLPKLFTDLNWRTNQLLYYSPQLLAKTNARTMCFPTNGRGIITPRFCSELWTNFEHSCAPTDVVCKAVSRLYAHTMSRVHAVQARFPNMTIDLTIMESQEDLQVCRGGISSLGFRRSDVSTVIRVRECKTINSCETVYVHDYRYETGFLTSDVDQWYRVVATLRVVGQSYFWLRSIALMLSCYFVFGRHSNASMRRRLRKARRLFMKIPTQAVVYGSPFPIACYVLAHLIDAPFTYDVLEGNFFSQAGVLNIKLESFISYAVVQMRNLWIYAFIWQSIARTLHWQTRGPAFKSGIIGIPEFLLSVFSSITLSAQYRSTSFRSSKILHMVVLPNNLGRSWVPVKYQYGFTHRGSGNLLLGGVIIDLKFFVCLVLIVSGMWLARKIQLECWAGILNETSQRYSKWFILAPTPVPYSAGTLWPTVSLCMYWTSDYFCIRQDRQGPWQELYQQTKQKVESEAAGRRSVLPFASCLKIRRVVVDNIQRHANKCKYAPNHESGGNTRTSRPKVDSLQFIQHQLKCLHGRGNDVEASVAFMNAVVMSDPLVFLRLRHGQDPSMQLGYYQSLLRPHQVVLLPVAVVGEYNEYTRNLKLLRRVNTADLSWSELVQCG